MALSNYDFFRDFNSIIPYDSINKMINKSLKKYSNYPKHNIEVYPDKYTYLFDLPGVKKEDIIISESNRILTIKGTRKEEIKEEKPDYKYTECNYGSFSRSFKLKEDSSTENINAQLNEGVLTINIPRREHVISKERTIDIK